MVRFASKKCSWKSFLTQSPEKTTLPNQRYERTFYPYVTSLPAPTSTAPFLPTSDTIGWTHVPCVTRTFLKRKTCISCKKIFPISQGIKQSSTRYARLWEVHDAISHCWGGGLFRHQQGDTYCLSSLTNEKLLQLHRSDVLRCSCSSFSCTSTISVQVVRKLTLSHPMVW